MYTSAFLLALGLAAQQVTATGGGWGAAKPFSCPGNTPTTCSNQQSGGFSWSGVNPGQSVSSYGGCGFSGVTCQSKGPGGAFKAKRTGGHGLSDKCVSGKISGDKKECPSVQAGKGQGAGEHFSPSHYGVSCSYDTQVNFEYKMPDGSTCKHTSPCQQGGNVVENKQCGGAVSVTCSQHEDEKKKNKGDCSIGFHSIQFQCGPATSIAPPPPPKVPSTSPAPPKSTLETKKTTEQKTTTPATSAPFTSKPSSAPATTPATTPVVPPVVPPQAPPASSAPASSAPASSAPSSSAPGTTAPASSTPGTTAGLPTPSFPANSTVPASSQPSASLPGTTTPVATSSPVNSSPATSSPATTPITTTFMTTSTAFVTTEITVISCHPTVTNCPAESKTPMVITSTISQFTTVCPVTATMVPGQSTFEVSKPSSAAASPSTAPAASSVPVSNAPASSAPASSVSSAAPSSSPAGGAPIPANCPSVVPSCINTLLQSVQTTCQNNGDASCFCGVANHTMFIQECITAHGADHNETQSALSFFQGLCAPQVPQNPSIITHQPAGAPQKPSCPSNVPATTVTIQYTTTVPCSEGQAKPTGAPAGNVTPAAAASPSMTVITTQSVITVPQVQITSQPAAPGATEVPPMALIPGPPSTTPAPAAAPAAPAYGAPAQITAADAVISTLASSIAVRPSQTGAINPPIATAGATKMGVSFGAVVVAAAILL